MLLSFLHMFLVDDGGAVTVDWVVLTAGLVGFGILVIGLIADGATDASTGVGARLSAADVPDIRFE